MTSDWELNHVILLQLGPPQKAPKSDRFVKFSGKERFFEGQLSTFISSNKVLQKKKSFAPTLKVAQILSYMTNGAAQIGTFMNFYGNFYKHIYWNGEVLTLIAGKTGYLKQHGMHQEFMYTVALLPTRVVKKLRQ